MDTPFDSGDEGLNSNSNNGQDPTPQLDSLNPSSLWDNDAAFDSLKMERAVRPDETPEQMTRRLLEQAAPQAALSIIQIALSSSNDNTRFKAASYITDKIYDDTAAATKAKWEDLVGDVVDQAEMYANKPE